MSGWSSNDAKDFLDVVKAVANKTFDSKNNILKTALAVVIDASDSINPTIRLLNSPDDGSQDFDVLNMSGESLVNGDSVWLNYWDGYTNAYIAVKNGEFTARGHADSHLLINGGFDIWQRGVTFTNPSVSSYTADRWKLNYYSANGGTLPTSIIHAQGTLGSGELYGLSSYYKITVNGAGSSFGANASYNICQPIENGTRLYAGDEKYISISFWARSTINGKKIGVELVQQYGTGGSPTATEYIAGKAVTLNSSWQLITHTFHTNSLVGKTFGTSNNDALRIDIALMWGSAQGSYVGESSAETFVGAGDIFIAGVQCCAGSVALPFVPRSYAEELRLCSRYAYPLGSGAYFYARMCYYTANSLFFFLPLPVTPRVNPSFRGVAQTDYNVYTTSGTGQTGFAFAAYAVNGGVIIIATKASHGLTDGMFLMAGPSGGLDQEL